MYRFTLPAMMAMLTVAVAFTFTVGCDTAPGSSDASAALSASNPSDPADRGHVPPGGLVMQGPVYSPDLNYVAYITDQDSPGLFELYVGANEAGATVTRIVNTLVPDGDVYRVMWMPDSYRLLFLADLDVDQEMWLYAVNYDGTGKMPVNPTVMPAGTDVIGMAVTPDCSLVVCGVDLEQTGEMAFFASMLDGQIWQKLSGNSPTASGPYDWSINADNSVTVRMNTAGAVTSTLELDWLPEGTSGLIDGPFPTTTDTASSQVQVPGSPAGS
jgi:hypothetical protein